MCCCSALVVFYFSCPPLALPFCTMHHLLCSRFTHAHTCVTMCPCRQGHRQDQEERGCGLARLSAHSNSEHGHYLYPTGIQSDSGLSIVAVAPRVTSISVGCSVCTQRSALMCIRGVLDGLWCPTWFTSRWHGAGGALTCLHPSCECIPGSAYQAHVQ